MLEQARSPQQDGAVSVARTDDLPENNTDALWTMATPAVHELFTRGLRQRFAKLHRNA